MAVFISLGVFVGIGLIFAGVFLATQKSNATTDRLVSVTTPGVDAGVFGSTGDRPEGSFVQRFLVDVGSWYESKISTDEVKVSKTRQLLSQAGWRSPNATAIYTGAILMTCLILAGILAGVALLAEMPDKALNLAIVGVVIGVVIPKVFINVRVSRRQEKITKTTPDVIDMLILCVESGLGLNTAIKRCAYELQAGRTREEAFRDLADRNGVEDLKSLAAFMIQSDKLGTNVADALRIYADESRNSRRQKAQETANKAAVKLLFPLVLFIFPTMFLIILGPAMLSLRANLPH